MYLDIGIIGLEKKFAVNVKAQIWWSPLSVFSDMKE